jgi:hypothetical protein
MSYQKEIPSDRCFELACHFAVVQIQLLQAAGEKDPEKYRPFSDIEGICKIAKEIGAELPDWNI